MTWPIWTCMPLHDLKQIHDGNLSYQNNSLINSIKGESYLQYKKSFITTISSNNLLNWRSQQSFFNGIRLYIHLVVDQIIVSTYRGTHGIRFFRDGILHLIQKFKQCLKIQEILNSILFLFKKIEINKSPSRNNNKKIKFNFKKKLKRQTKTFLCCHEPAWSGTPLQVTPPIDWRTKVG